MFLSIPSSKTINEYKNLKATQTPIKIKSTSPELDEYVYDKRGWANTLSIVGLTAAIDILGGQFIAKNLKLVHTKTPKLPKNKALYKGLATVTMGLFNLSVIANLIESTKTKEQILSNENSKLNLYRKKGINAVI